MHYYQYSQWVDEWEDIEVWMGMMRRYRLRWRRRIGRDLELDDMKRWIGYRKTCEDGWYDMVRWLGKDMNGKIWDDKWGNDGKING